MTKRIIYISFLCLLSLWSQAQPYRIGDLVVNEHGEKGIVFWLHPEGTGGWAAALHDIPAENGWGPEIDIPDLPNIEEVGMLDDIWGDTNTKIMRDYLGPGNTYPAQLVDFEKGWYIPAKTQLEILVGMLPFVEQAFVNHGGTSMQDALYFSSTEYSYVSSVSGINISSLNFNFPQLKTDHGFVRPVFTFTTFTYLWNTGATTPVITEHPTQTTTYTVQVTTQAGCSATASAQVFVADGVNDTIRARICAGETYRQHGFNVSAPGEYSRTISGAEGCNTQVVLYLTVGQPDTLCLSATLCEGNRYTANNFNASTPGEHIQRLSRPGQCDSVVILTLAVTPSVRDTIHATVCSGDTYAAHGFSLPNITASGTHHLTLQTATGCDSIVTLELTVLDSIVQHEAITICQNELPYTWRENIIPTGTNSKTIRYANIAASGCDSIVYLALTVNDSIVQQESITICQNELPYTWRGNNIPTGTDSKTIRYAGIAASGCDSIVTLELTVLDSIVQHESLTLCQNELPYTWRENIIPTGTNSKTIRYAGIAAAGCDSIVYLALTVNDSIVQHESLTLCQNELPYTWRGNIIPTGTNSKTIRYANIAASGCDSIVYLTLTVHPVRRTTLRDSVCPGSNYTAHGFALSNVTASGTHHLTLQSAQGCDSIVTLELHVHPTYLFPSAASICQGDTIDFRGKRLFTPGVYDDTLATRHGCDSIYRLTLTVNPRHNITFSDVLCKGEPYTGHGFTLPAVLEDTVVKDTLQTVHGCDSVVTLSLTILPLYNTPVYDTVCEGEDYTAHGFALSDVQQSGLHTLVLTSRAGCDSTLTLHLTVHPIRRTTLRDSVCPGSNYTAHGFALSNVTASGTHQLTLQSAQGCDSIVTLELHVHPTYLFPSAASICQGDTIDFRGKRLYTPGTYDDTLATRYGCDSIYRLTLTVNPRHNITFSDVLCEGEVYTDYGFTTSQPGVYTRHLQTTCGCDSTVTLHLAEEKKITGSIALRLEDCISHAYSFYLDITDSAGVAAMAYAWDMGNGDSSHDEEGIYSYADSGAYGVHLSITSANGCESRFTHHLQVPLYVPEVSIEADRTVIDEDFPTVRFHAEVPAGMTCTWEFGDGTTGEGAYASHTYTINKEERFYEVRMQVINADSCVTESTVQLEALYFPQPQNTFSPNGDGINDRFMAGCRVEIVNRNGLRIFAGDDGWDGSYNGEQTPEDVYFYRLYYRTVNGERVKTGYITLLR